VMAVLLDNEKLTKDHIQDLINQSQVELCQIDDSQTESNDADGDFFE
jgi:mannose PTS system EIIA component